jgi:hypothetical protein
MGDEILGRADTADDGANAGEMGDAGAERDAWRRGFRDPENWHDLAERGTPRNG